MRTLSIASAPVDDLRQRRRQLPSDAGRVYTEHFAANERAGAFYEREGLSVERIEPGPTAAPEVVWRVRELR